MNCITIEPSELEGIVRIPPSKSISHRAVICAGLAEGTSTIENVIFSEDIEATLDGMGALGAVANRVQDTLQIQGNPVLRIVRDRIHCRESGSTLRFLIPLAALTGEEVTFTGEGKLGERPLEAYYQMFQEHGITYHTNDGLLPLTVKGSFQPGKYRLKGNSSSQFITGLLFMLPLLKGDSKIFITTELESRGYVDLTIDVLKRFGIQIHNVAYKEFFIKGNQKYKSTQARIEGDYSQAAFWIVAGTLGKKIYCLDLNPTSLQGDRAVLNIVREMGGNITNINMKDGMTEKGLEVQAAQTKGTVIDAGQCPDLVPILAVLGALSQGTTRIINAGRLRIKESDRLKAIATELNKLGAKVLEQDEGLLIEGVEQLRGGTVDSWNDHRIAMALAVASIKCTGPVIITGAQAVRKSYPHFWNDFNKLGGKIK